MWANVEDGDRGERSPRRGPRVGSPGTNAASPPLVLVVEDDADHRSLLNAALGGAGYEIAEAEDGSSAIEYLLHNPTPSIILLDLHMPRVSGWDVLSVMRSYIRLRRIPVIVVTGQPATVQVPGVSVVGRVQKPVRMPELVTLVRRYVKPAPPPAEG